MNRHLPKFLIALLLAAMLTSPAAGAERPAPKSPIKAFLVAVFPGVVVHGLGHQYAGRTGTARILRYAGVASYHLLGISFFSIVAGGLSGWMNIQDLGLDFSSFSFAEWLGLTGFSSLALGGLLFLGSWLYDICFAPAAARATVAVRAAGSPAIALLTESF